MKPDCYAYDSIIASTVTKTRRTKQQQANTTEASYHRVCIMAFNSEPEPEPYDPLNVPVLNGLFHVIFDTLTPRPHFIIKPKEPTVVDLDFAKMIEEQTQLQTLMEAVESMMQMMRGYGINCSILSFHRGSWHTKHPKRTFHAHICVDIKLYEKVFLDKVAQSLSWTQDKVNSYCEDVCAYKKKKQAKYFPEAVSNIEKTKDVSKKLQTVDEKGITQVLHPSHPKIGFVGKKNTQPEISLPVIEKFAQDLGLTNMALENVDGNKGCQVCLYLGPERKSVVVPPSEGWSQTAPDEEVLGYIVISGPLFYQFCPDEEYREKWFLNFKKCKFACVT